jgi:hypothetical protein
LETQLLIAVAVQYGAQAQIKVTFDLLTEEEKMLTAFGRSYGAQKANS